MQGKINSTMNKTDWITPKRIIDALGRFDLDPCCPWVMPWRTAGRMLQNTHPEGSAMLSRQNSLPLVEVIYGDGLSEKWEGRVWLNPPYNAAQDSWLEKLVAHGNGIALIPAATETKRFRKFVWHKASAVCFVYGRLNFCDFKGVEYPGNVTPSVLVAYGEENAGALRRCGIGACLRGME